jgi:carbonic anhydrase
MEDNMIGIKLLSMLVLSFYLSGGHDHWDYEHVDHWGKINKTCNDGKSQSPIDLKGASSSDADPLIFEYTTSIVNVKNNGHTVQADYASGSILKANGDNFELKQFHFHSPSEHTVDGKHYPMEVHLVHIQPESGQIAVVGVFLEKGGSSNKVVDTVLKDMPEAHKSHTMPGAFIKANDLLPNNKTHYRYSGSLTTPPCSENVLWHVMKHPIKVSNKHYDAFVKLIGENARPVQPLHGRPLKSVSK